MTTVGSTYPMVPRVACSHWPAGPRPDHNNLWFVRTVYRGREPANMARDLELCNSGARCRLPHLHGGTARLALLVTVRLASTLLYITAPYGTKLTICYVLLASRVACARQSACSRLPDHHGRPCPAQRRRASATGTCGFPRVGGARERRRVRP